MPKSSSRMAINQWDTRRANLDTISQFHLLLYLSLFPSDSPARLARMMTIEDLEIELRARTIRIEAETELLNRQIEARRARLKDDLLPFLKK